MEDEHFKRFQRLPDVEKRRLTHLVEFISNGGKLTDSLLAGFPREARDLLADIFEENLKRRRKI